jgi:hypothetical protein
MLVARYFLYVGAALLALLFVVSAELPLSPAVEATKTAAALTIRIHSDRKWPERVVFDTNAPTIVPAPTQTASNAPATATAAPAQVADVSTKVKPRDAFAQLTPADLKKLEVKRVQKRKVAKRRVSPPTMLPPPTMLVAQRPQFGLFANNIW